MRFTVYDHAGKGIYLQQRLIEAGHEHSAVKDLGAGDVLLLDCDWPWAHPRPELIDYATSNGVKVALYPHGGRPTVFVYDGIAEPDRRVSLRLEHGQGSVEMAEIFAEDLHQEAPGWLFSPTRDFTPTEGKRILFAPLHPNIEAIQKGTNGHDPAPLINQQIYRRLLDLKDVEIVVSLAGPAWRTGVWPHPRTRFSENPMMLFHHSFEQILSADVVIAAGTMAAASVALGTPTVMFCQDSFMDYVNGEYVQAEHQDEYRDVRYPLDTDDGDLSDLIAAACAEEQSQWRDLWVGRDGTEAAILLLEDLVGEKETDVKRKKKEVPPKKTSEPVVKHVTIQGVTATAGAKGKET